MTTAKEGSEKFGDQAREFMEQEFYVDDSLKSFATTEEAIVKIKNTQAMCASANLFFTSSPAIANLFPSHMSQFQKKIVQMI